MPYAKTHIRVKVPNRSGFDKSHRNSGTGLVGQLLPLLCDEVVPNTRISLRIPISTQLPPLVSDTYMNMKHKVEAFFVPGRLLCKSYEPWFCDVKSRVLYNSSVSEVQQNGTFTDATPAIPCVKFDSSLGNNIPRGAGSLLDYLGYGRASAQADTINLLPLIAYHLVWDAYYKNPNVQNPAFVHEVGIADTGQANTYPRIATIIDAFFTYSGGSFGDHYLYTLTGTNYNSFKCADGVSLFDIRQRNFGLDLFTGARVSAQQGAAASVTLAIPAGTNTSGGTTTFTIAQLRAANSLQMFRERNQLPGSRLVEQVKARYGANLSDGVAQRPICIGSATYDYGSRGVSQTAPAGSTATSNPFDGIAAQYGRAYAAGNDFLIEDFVANEPGYILVLHSQVPEVTYTYGIDPMFMRYIGAGSIVEMANPLLQNVGDEPIECDYINGSIANNVFGYNDRFCNFMFKKNCVHGKLRQGENLSSFVLQRAINGGSPSLNTSFLEIPTTYLDDVMQVASSTSGVTFWYDAMLDYKISMPLAEFSIPSLQDPAYEHGQSVNLRRNGQIF